MHPITFLGYGCAIVGLILFGTAIIAWLVFCAGVLSGHPAWMLALLAPFVGVSLMRLGRWLVEEFD